MQTKNTDGSYGKVLPLDMENLEELLMKPSVERVEVFKATGKEIKNHNKFRTGKRFRKAPKIK